MAKMDSSMDQETPADAAGSGEEADASAQGESGAASQLVADISDKMMSLMDLLDKSDAIPPEDKSKLGQIISQYNDFVQSLNAGPGQAPQSPEDMAQGGTVSPMQGGSPGSKPHSYAGA